MQTSQRLLLCCQEQTTIRHIIGMSRGARGGNLCGQKTASAVSTELGVENVFFGSLRWVVSKDCMVKTESLVVGTEATPGSASPWCKWTRREPHIRTCGC